MSASGKCLSSAAGDPPSCARPSSRTRLESALDSARVRVERSQRNRLSPARRHSSLASNECCPATGLCWRSCSCSLVTGRKMYTGRRLTLRMDSDKQRTAAGRAAKVRVESEKGHGGSRRPPPWPMGAASVAATIAFRNFRARVLVSSFCFFSASLFSPLLAVFFGSLTACTPFRCVTLAV